MKTSKKTLGAAITLGLALGAYSTAFADTLAMNALVGTGTNTSTQAHADVIATEPMLIKGISDGNGNPLGVASNVGYSIASTVTDVNYVLGGYSNAFAVTNNTITLSDDASLSGANGVGQLLAGYAYGENGKASAGAEGAGNVVNIEAGTVSGPMVAAGFAAATGVNAAEASYNSIEQTQAIAEFSSTNGAYGGWAQAEQGVATANNNNVKFYGSTTTPETAIDLYGGYAEADTGNAVTNANDVTIAGGVAGYVYGGSASGNVGEDDSAVTGTANSNKITIGNSTVNYFIRGGDAEVYGSNTSSTAEADGNEVTLQNGAVAGLNGSQLLGGYAGAENGSAVAGAEGAGNTVTIDGESITLGDTQTLAGVRVVGGYAEVEGTGDASASYNEVIKKNKIAALYINEGDGAYGGYASANSGSATANNNTVTFYGGANDKDYVGGVYGGYAETVAGSATANKNTVTLVGGTVANLVGGSASGATETATNNTVKITAGKVTGYVHAGEVFGGEGVTDKITDNAINISGKADLTSADLYGYYNENVDGDGETQKYTHSGNTLNVAADWEGSDGTHTVGSIQNFDKLNFVLAESAKSTSTEQVAALNVANKVDLSNVGAVEVNTDMSKLTNLDPTMTYKVLNDSEGISLGDDVDYKINASDTTLLTDASGTKATVNANLDNMTNVVLKGMGYFYDSTSSTLNIGTNDYNYYVNGTSDVTGDVTLNSTLVIDDATGKLNVTNGKTLTLNGLTQDAGSTTVATGSTLVLKGTSAINGGVVTNNGTLTNAGTLTNTGTVSGAVTNSGTLTNKDNGILSGTVTNSGTMTTTANGITGGVDNSKDLTLTGGALASNITGSGTTTIDGTVTSANKIANAVVVNAEKSFTNSGTVSGAVTNNSTLTNKDNGILSGKVTNSGTMTTTANGITGGVENNKDLTLTGGALASNITGSGVTTIAGTVTSAKNIANAVVVNAEKSFTNSGTVSGNVTNNGTLDSSLADLATSAGSTVINNGTFNLNGDVSKAVSASTGTGTLNITGDATLSASVNNQDIFVTDGKTLTANTIESKNYLNSTDNLTLGKDSVLDMRSSATSATEKVYNNHTVNTLTANDAKLSFDLDVSKKGSADEVKSDTITAAKATGKVTLNSVNVSADFGGDPGVGNTISFTLVNSNDVAGLTIAGTATAMSNGYMYVFEQDSTNKGNLTATKSMSATLAEIVQNQTKADYKLGNIATYSLVGDYADTQDLGVLTRVDQDTPSTEGGTTIRNFTINGNEHTLSTTSASKGGITVANSDDTLNLKNVKIQGFATVVTNNGNLNVEDVTFTGNSKDITNTNTVNFTGTNTLADGLTNSGTVEVKSGTTTVTGLMQTAGSIAVDNASTLVLAGESKIAKNATITNNGTLSNTGSLQNRGTVTGALTNSGTMTNEVGSSISGNVTNNAGATLTATLADLATGDGSTFTNAGTFNMNGALSKDIKGSGTTVLQNDITLTGANASRRVYGTLDANDKNINMQESGSDASYNTLTVGTLAGSGSLNIDADLSSGVNDKLNVGATAANTQLSLNSILVRADSTATSGIVTYVTGTGASSDNLTYLLNGNKKEESATVVSATSKYTYTFSLDTTKGVVDYERVANPAGTYNVGEFIEGQKDGKVIAATNYTMQESEDLSRNVTTSTYDIRTSKELSLGINKDTTLKGTSTEAGITVAKEFSLNVMGASGATITGMGTALKNEGKLKVSDVTFSGNTTDIQNSGTISFENTNTLADGLTNSGTVEVKSGTTTVTGLTQTKGSVTVDSNVTLKITGENNRISAGTITNNGTLTNSGELYNAGTVDGALTNSGTLTNKGTLSGSVTNSGTMTTTANGITGGVANSGAVTLTAGTLASDITGDGTTTIDGTVTSAKTIDNAVTINKGKNFTNIGKISGAVTNEGTFVTTADGIKAGVTNSGAVTLTGGTLTSDVTGEGTVTINGVLSNGAKVSGTVMNNGTLSNNAGGEVSGTVTNIGTLANNATVSGTVTNIGVLSNNATLSDGVVTNIGMLTNNAGGSISDAVTNSGTLSNNAGGTISGTVTNSGTLTNAGTLSNAVTNSNMLINNGSLTSDVTNSGTFMNNVAISGSVENSGTMTNATGATISGNVTNNAGATLNATLADLSNFTNKGTFNMNGALSKDIAGTGTTVLQNNITLTGADASRTVAGTLDASGKNINMQESGDTVQYNTLTVGTLAGSGSLNIDADLANNNSDKLSVGAAAAGTQLSLNSILVRANSNATSGTVTYVTGEGAGSDNLTYLLNGKTAGTVVSATSAYTYTFSLDSTKGVVTYTREANEAGTYNVGEFIEGKKDDKVIAATNYTMQSDETLQDDVSTTGNEKRTSTELTVGINAGKSLTGAGTQEFGITVTDGYTLNILGASGAQITNMKTALTNAGTLTVSDVTLTGNSRDIENSGTASLNNVIATSVANANALTLSGTNTLATISGEGATEITSGDTNVTDLSQSKLTVDNDAKLTQNGSLKADTIDNSGTVDLNNILAGTIDNKGTANLNNVEATTISNASVLSLSGTKNSIGAISGEGSTEITSGKVTVNSGLTQNSLTVGSGAELTENGGLDVEVIINNGKANLSDANATSVANAKTLTLSGTNTLATISGEGSTEIISGATTVNGDLAQKSLTVDSDATLIQKDGSFVSSTTLTNNGTITFDNVDLGGNDNDDTTVKFGGTGKVELKNSSIYAHGTSGVGALNTIMGQNTLDLQENSNIYTTTDQIFTNAAYNGFTTVDESGAVKQKNITYTAGTLTFNDAQYTWSYLSQATEELAKEQGSTGDQSKTKIVMTGTMTGEYTTTNAAEATEKNIVCDTAVATVVEQDVSISNDTLYYVVGTKHDNLNDIAGDEKKTYENAATTSNSVQASALNLTGQDADNKKNEMYIGLKNEKELVLGGSQGGDVIKANGGEYTGTVHFDVGLTNEAGAKETEQGNLTFGNSLAQETTEYTVTGSATVQNGGVLKNNSTTTFKTKDGSDAAGTVILNNGNIDAGTGQANLNVNKLQAQGTVDTSNKISGNLNADTLETKIGSVINLVEDGTKQEAAVVTATNATVTDSTINTGAGTLTMATAKVTNSTITASDSNNKGKLNIAIVKESSVLVTDSTINAGAGTLTMGTKENVTAKTATVTSSTIAATTGTINLNNATVTDKSTIAANAGTISISNTEVTNGSTITATTGTVEIADVTVDKSSKIDAGVGTVSIVKATVENSTISASDTSNKGTLNIATKAESEVKVTSSTINAGAGTLNIATAEEAQAAKVTVKNSTIDAGTGTLNIATEDNKATVKVENSTIKSTSATMKMGTVTVQDTEIHTGAGRLNVTNLNTANTNTVTGNIKVTNLTVSVSISSVLNIGNQDNAGIVSIITAILSGNIIFIDPAWKNGGLDEASRVAVQRTTLDGKYVVGQNSLLSFGTEDTTDAVKMFNNVASGGEFKWAEDSITSAVYIDKSIDLTDGSSALYADGNFTSTNSPTKDSLKNRVEFAANSMLMVNGSNVERDDSHSKIAAINISKNDTSKVNIDAGSKLYIDIDKVEVGKEYQIINYAGNDYTTPYEDSFWSNDNTLTSSVIIGLQRVKEGGKDTGNVSTVYIAPHNTLAGQSILKTLQNDTGEPRDFLLKAASTSLSRSSQLDNLNSVAAMTELAGVGHATLSANGLFTDAVNEHISLAKPLDHEYDVWAKYIHSKESVDSFSIGGLMGAEYDAQFNGIVAGVDVMHKGKGTVGVALTYMDGDINGSSLATNTRNDSKYYGVSVYGAIQNKATAVIGDISYLHSSNDIKQENSGYDLTGSAKADTFSIGVKAEAAYENGANKFVPYVGLRFLHLGIGDYSNSLGMEYNTDEKNMAILPLGVKYAYTHKLEKGAFRTYAELGYVVNLTSGDSKQNISWNGGNDSYDFDLADRGTLNAKLGFELENRNLSYGLGYELQRSSNTSDNRFTVNLNWKF